MIMEETNMSKEVNTRISQKHDIEVNWLKAKNFVPMAGELIIYDKEKNSDPIPSGRGARYDYARYKIGDGVTTVNNLPFENQGTGNFSNKEGYYNTSSNTATHAEGYST
jgi:hypothetical protein